MFNLCFINLMEFYLFVNFKSQGSYISNGWIKLLGERLIKKSLKGTDSFATFLVE